MSPPFRGDAAHRPEPARIRGEDPDADRGERQEDIEDIEHISIAKLYNSVVDGLAGHLIVDTRSADDYDQGHIWGAIDLEEALTYRGKHILLVSQACISRLLSCHGTTLLYQHINTSYC